MNKALQDLYKVMKIEGIDRKSGRVARELALEDWIATWVEEISTSQSIIKKNITSEDEDFIKYHMAYRMGDVLMESCIQVDLTPNKISTKIMAIRR